MDQLPRDAPHKYDAFFEPLMNWNIYSLKVYVFFSKIPELKVLMIPIQLCVQYHYLSQQISKPIMRLALPQLEDTKVVDVAKYVELK